MSRKTFPVFEVTFRNRLHTEFDLRFQLPVREENMLIAQFLRTTGMNDIFMELYTNQSFIIEPDLKLLVNPLVSTAIPKI